MSTPEICRRLTARRLHPEVHEGLTKHLRTVAVRMDPAYTKQLREDTGNPEARSIFISHDQSALRDAADEIERLRDLNSEASGVIAALWKALVAADTYIATAPCDPDITDKQRTAYRIWKNHRSSLALPANTTCPGCTDSNFSCPIHSEPATEP